GRLIIYREGHTELPVCLYISNLRDLKPGINEFFWNGRDLNGNMVPPDSLTYYTFIYNKKAPATWVAVGPQSRYGMVSIERTLSGLKAVTHDDRSLRSFSIGGSVRAPEPRDILFLENILDGQSITGLCRGEDERVYIGTSAGIVCVYVRKGKAVHDISFGNSGYIAFKDYRGRLPGNPSYSNGVLYVGMGGGGGRNVCIAVLDGKTGEFLSEIDLGDFFGMHANPPSITATEKGLYCAHPDNAYVLNIEHNGDIRWICDASDRTVGKDTDGRSFMYGIGVDQYGFSYVNTPGYSARCAVIGPDGMGLFRVILVSLPGLRVSSAVPMIEGKETDGLYFVTRGGDIPYIFHVPYTIRKGLIVDEEEYILTPTAI
ncbi:hypothetical protein ACFL1R_08195, partial [Candidatus Latescibacterota bacterium]